MYTELTLSELSKKLKNREVTSVQVTEEYLGRIEKVDAEIGSYITVCKEEAMEAARDADKRIADGNATELTGIPMGIKDNICTKDIKTTCGSKMLCNFVPPYDATVIKRLKADGAVILGKLNMDEFAMGSSVETSYFKKTQNPYDLTRVPGGSSGGSAAALSADLAAFTLGSDTGGSIRQPASFCGNVGMKPTYGAVSRFGLVAFASSLDQIGSFTKTVEDCAIVLNHIAGYDSLDSTSANVEYPDYKNALTGDVKGMKIGVPSQYFGEGVDPEVRTAIKEGLEILKARGAEYEMCELSMAEYALPVYYIIAAAEASSNLARFDGIKYGFRAEKYTDLLDLYKETRSQGFGEEVKRRIMMGTYVLSSGNYDAYYKRAQKARTLIEKDFSEKFAKYDVLLTPTTPTTAFAFGERKDPLSMYMADICTVAVNIAGLPAVSVPAGLDSKGLPMGLQLIGNSFCESKILKAAYAYEKITEYDKIRPFGKEGK